MVAGVFGRSDGKSAKDRESCIPHPNPRCGKYDSHVLVTRKLLLESWKRQFRASDDEIRRTVV